MKNIFLIPCNIAFILLSSSINLFSQQKLSEFAVQIAKPTEVYISSDGAGNVATVFQSQKQYEFDFLDSEFNLIGTQIVEKVKTDKNQQVLGAILNGEECSAYFYNSKLKAFTGLSVNRATGKSSYSRLMILNTKDQFLNAFELNGKFYILTVPQHSNTLKVLALSGLEKEEMTYTMDMPGFYAALSKDNDKLNSKASSEAGIEAINYELENNIKSSYPDKKLYHFDNKIVMTFDEPGLTHMITLDVATKKTNYKKLTFTLEKGNNASSKQGNSFMYKNRLFRTTISPEQLNISILDLDSMKLVNTYNFYPHQDISIINGQIIQEGAVEGFTTEEKVLKKTEQYFKKVLNGNLAIAANKIDSNKYSLQVGSYEIYNNMPYNRPGFSGPQFSVGMGMGVGMGVGMGGFGYPYGGGYYPGSYYGYPGYYSNQSATTRQRMVYFNSMLGQENFEHVKENIPNSLNDRINEFERQEFNNTIPEVTMIASYKNSLLLGYYLKGNKKFNIVKFREGTF